MNRKRKLSALLLTLLVLSALALPAAADAIWEPPDPFYESHQDSCTFVGRSYELAGYDGTVNLWTAPNGMVKASYRNGERWIVQFRYSASNGTDWGYVYSTGDGGAEGWMPLDDLSLIYDSESFLEDHKDDFFTDTVTADFHEACIYSYPHGPFVRTLEEDSDYLTFSELFTGSSLYTDENGLRWGLVSYYMGHVDGWVCLDDPMNESLDDGIVPVSPSPAQLRGSATVSSGPLNSPVVLTAAGIAVLMAVTLLLIRKFHPKKRAPEAAYSTAPACQPPSV